MTIQSIADKQANRAAKLEAAKNLLAASVAALQTSEGWQSMLRSLAKAARFGLRRFSFRNQLLILGQRPTACEAATFNAWKRAGRHVLKGERALTILAPVIVHKDAEGESKDERDILVGFRPLPVFSKDQTAPLPGSKIEPEPSIEEYVRNVENAGTFSETVETLRGFALANLKDEVSGIELRSRRAGDHPEANGWYDVTTKAIVVVTETSPAMQTKTMCHELAHAILHGAGSGHDRAEGEVEAESTAFVVLHALGIDSASYSLGYVAHWSGQQKADALILKSGQRIVTAANKILDAFESVHSEPELKEAA